MDIENAGITLEHDGHGIPQGGEDRGGMEWTYLVNAEGDDGKNYRIDYHISRYLDLRSMFPALGVSQGADLWVMAIRHEKGEVSQPSGSSCKIADFSPGAITVFQHYPVGTLTIDKSEDKVEVNLEDAHLICRDDYSWHLNAEDKEQGIKVELVHYGAGLPTWYSGKDEPQEWTPHNIAYGYFWSGLVEGTLTIDGRKVKIKGKGVRQRCLLVEMCNAEIGGWHDWMWFHFDELFGCLDELKLSKFKVMSIYLVDENQYLAQGSFNIEHHDWAYLRQVGFFIPTRYRVTMETDAGVLEMSARVIGYFSWGVTSEVPDAPFVSLDWDHLEGTFTYKDGRKKTLTNGIGGTLIRQWKPYPNVYEWFIPEIAGSKSKVGI